MANFSIGDKVTYIQDYNNYSQGIVSSLINEKYLSQAVVYKCNNDWENYNNYTGQLTAIDNLENGWKFKNGDYVYFYSNRVKRFLNCIVYDILSNNYYKIKSLSNDLFLDEFIEFGNNLFPGTYIEVEKDRIQTVIDNLENQYV